MSSLPGAGGPIVASGSFSEPAETSWQRELSAAIRSVEELLFRAGLNPDNLPLEVATQRIGLNLPDARTLTEFPILVPENYLRRMKSGDPADPLLRQVFALQTEDDRPVGFEDDPVGDLQARNQAGLLQKYEGRALLIASGACAIHCRYCFRRKYPYSDEPRRIDDWAPTIDRIRADSSLTEVILSGGDPLTLNDSRIRTLCGMIDEIPHVERIRFHTRLPIVLPSRVTPELINLLRELRAQPIIVVHANHPAEISGDCEAGLRQLVRNGFPVLNQAVLLRDINDSADVLELLCRRLTGIGVLPYYLHQLDRVNGAAHFEVNPELGQSIIRQLRIRLPGYAVPRYVAEIAGAGSKTDLM